MKSKPQSQEYLTLVVKTDDGGLATFVPDLNLGFKIKPEFTTNFYDIAENTAFNQAVNELRFTRNFMEYDLYTDKIKNPTPTKNARTQPVIISQDTFIEGQEIVITTLQLNASNIIIEAQKSCEQRKSKYRQLVIGFKKEFLTENPQTPDKVIYALKNFTKSYQNIGHDILNQASGGHKKPSRPNAA